MIVHFNLNRAKSKRAKLIHCKWYLNNKLLNELLQNCQTVKVISKRGITTTLKMGIATTGGNNVDTFIGNFFSCQKIITCSRFPTCMSPTPFNLRGASKGLQGGLKANFTHFSQFFPAKLGLEPELGGLGGLTRCQKIRDKPPTTLITGSKRPPTPRSWVIQVSTLFPFCLFLLLPF